MQSLKAESGEEFVGGKLCDHFGSELGGPLVSVAVVGLDEEFDRADTLIGGSAIAPDGSAFDGGVSVTTGVFVSGGNAVADFVCERMLGKNFEELSTGDDDVFVTCGGSVTVHLFERHGGALGILCLRSGELTGVSDISENLFVFEVELGELSHDFRSGGRGLGGLLELGFQVVGPVSMSGETEGDNEGEMGNECLQNPAFLSAPTILLASEAISLSG